MNNERARIMSIVALAAAVGASICWAAGAIIAQTPSQRLGAFEFTRTQLISAATILVLIVSGTGGWHSVSWSHWPNFVVGSIVGVVISNLAMTECLRRGGPRRTALLIEMKAPITCLLGHVFLGETLSLSNMAGVAITIGGVALAIGFRPGGQAVDTLHGRPSTALLLGVVAATAQAIGLIVMKPALLAGTDPLAASALRTGGGAAIVTLIALWPAKILQPLSERTGRLVLWTIGPGILGYVIAVSLLLYALGNYHAGIVSALGSLSPVIMLPILWFKTKRRPPVPAWIGASLAVAGVAILLADF